MKLNEDERKAFRSDELLVGIVKGDAIAHRCRVKHFFCDAFVRARSNLCDV